MKYIQKNNSFWRLKCIWNSVKGVVLKVTALSRKNTLHMHISNRLSESTFATSIVQNKASVSLISEVTPDCQWNSAMDVVRFN
jgi:hypothetical protein